MSSWCGLRRGWYSSDANVQCTAPGHRELVSATPGPNLTLLFHFPAGTPEGEVTELVSKPGLSAFVTVDRETHTFWASVSSINAWQCFLPLL